MCEKNIAEAQYRIYYNKTTLNLFMLLAVIVEINNDKEGIVWPKEVAPYNIHLIQVSFCFLMEK